MQAIKAGAYLWYQGHFVFEAGPHPQQRHIVVIRLGGHIEPGESPETCAVRELEEEARVRAKLVPAPASYVADLEQPLRLVASDGAGLLTTHAQGRCTRMYLAVTREEPAPGDAKGLLFLPPDALRAAGEGERSLPALIAKGARHVPRAPVQADLPLLVGPQVKLLAEILRLHPDLPAYLDRQNR